MIYTNIRINYVGAQTKECNMRQTYLQMVIIAMVAMSSLADGVTGKIGVDSRVSRRNNEYVFKFDYSIVVTEARIKKPIMIIQCFYENQDGSWMIVNNAYAPNHSVQKGFAASKAAMSGCNFDAPDVTLYDATLFKRGAGEFRFSCKSPLAWRVQLYYDGQLLDQKDSPYSESLAKKGVPSTWTEHAAGRFSEELEILSASFGSYQTNTTKKELTALLSGMVKDRQLLIPASPRNLSKQFSEFVPSQAEMTWVTGGKGVLKITYKFKGRKKEVEFMDGAEVKIP